MSVCGQRLRAFLVLCLCCLSGGGVLGQQGAVSADLRQRRQEAAEPRVQAREARDRRMRALARAHGLPFETEGGGGRRMTLAAFTEDGAPRPIYLTGCASSAALSTGASLLHEAPYALSGTDMLIGIWDEGRPRLTHRELAGRVTVGDGTTTTSAHGTHVSGILASSGVDPTAKGMAPAAALYSCDWNSDWSEMLAIGALAPNEDGAIQISNHSYGYIFGWYFYDGYWTWFGIYGESEDRGFGQYDEACAEYDFVCAEAPYYLPFVAAGNSRTTSTPSPGATFRYWDAYTGGWVYKAYVPGVDPGSNSAAEGGYDTLLVPAVAKNVVTVGSVTDAAAGGVRTTNGVALAVDSSWGPADDGRIKPDLVANGVGVRSAHSNTDASYASWSGTSMASPNAAGSAALLVELARRWVPAGGLRASTLKGLLIHTADDLGRAGPDYSYGWGLVNVQRAADLLLARFRDAVPGVLVEEQALFLDPVAYDVVAAGGPLRATLCWTDPAGTPRAGLDERTAVLVNDLDLRVRPVDNPWQAAQPFVLDWLNPTSPATAGDNTRDPVEQVLIAHAASGSTHRVVVSSKHALPAHQVFSLILSGAQAAAPVPATFAEAVDQPARAFTFSGPGWTFDTAVTVDGLDAARSKLIPHGGAVSADTAVSGEAWVRFWWRVSSEAANDVAQFSVDNVALRTISGESGWMFEQHRLGAGSHALAWRYQKNGSLTAGSDCLWIDQLEILPINPATVILIR